MIQRSGVCDACQTPKQSKQQPHFYEKFGALGLVVRWLGRFNFFVETHIRNANKGSSVVTQPRSHARADVGVRMRAEGYLS